MDEVDAHSDVSATMWMGGRAIHSDPPVPRWMWAREAAPMDAGGRERIGQVDWTASRGRERIGQVD